MELNYELNSVVFLTVRNLDYVIKTCSAQPCLKIGVDKAHLLHTELVEEKKKEHAQEGANHEMSSSDHRS